MSPKPIVKVKMVKIDEQEKENRRRKIIEALINEK